MKDYITEIIWGGEWWEKKGRRVGWEGGNSYTHQTKSWQIITEKKKADSEEESNCPNEYSIQETNIKSMASMLLEFKA